MKKIYFSVLLIVLMSSCKPTLYMGNYGQVNQTQVVLSESNFTVLGSFKGIAIEKRNKISIKELEGLISKAKTNLLANAKSEGVTLVGGSKTLVNFCVDVIENSRMVKVTVSAEIIEFTK